MRAAAVGVHDPDLAAGAVAVGPEQDAGPIRRPVGAVCLQIGVREALDGTAVGIHDPYGAHVAAPVALEGDLVPVGHRVGVAAQRVPYAGAAGQPPHPYRRVLAAADDD